MKQFLFLALLRARTELLLITFALFMQVYECAISFTDKSLCLEKFPACQPDPGNLKQREATGAAEQVNVNP